MKPIEKLREVLCTVPEIKEDLMEFKKGCIITYNPIKNNVLLNYQYITTSILTTKVNKDYLFADPIYHYFTPVKIKRFQITKIIGNPIQERHLRMYCEEKEIELYSAYGCCVVSVMDDLDDTKDLQDQPDEVIESIVEFLESKQ